uniref:Uncharacterized protein n=1 Tax=Branchiostoma floridae TaxID=7739 RepID=C3YMA5_BRAFL|eukprot:XP_002602687.1 hypothetical protein BRAFLDRAFT_72950 [Branchiostoma floridae]
MAQVFTLPEGFPFTILDVSTLLVFLFTFVLAVRFLRGKRSGNLPPLVPGGWPLVHHLPTLISKDFRAQVDQWAREFGEVYRVKFLGKEIYVVSGYPTLKKMMEKDEFSTRSDPKLGPTLGGQGNIICALVFGKRYDYGDTRFQHLLTTMANLGVEVARWEFPFITYIPGLQDPIAGTRFHSKKLQQFIREEIDLHRLNLDPEDPRDFIDYCLLQLDQQDGEGTWLKEENVVFIIQSLFMAGTDTTAATLTWAMLYMVLYPDVQAELDSVLGATKPSLAHRDQLPYTTATIMEVERIRHIGPVLFARQSTGPTRLRGYDIAEGTLVIVVLIYRRY